MYLSFKISYYTNVMLFFFLPKHLLHTVAATCNLRRNSETSTNLIFLLHSFTDRRVLLTMDLGNINQYMTFSPCPLVEKSTFSLKEGTLWLLFGLSEL